MDGGDGDLLPFLIRGPDLHTLDHIHHGDFFHPARSVVEGHLRGFARVVKRIHKEAGILPPWTDASRAVVTVKADDRFAESLGKMERTGVG